jgi:hypothetical protein
MFALPLHALNPLCPKPPKGKLWVAICAITSLVADEPHGRVFTKEFASLRSLEKTYKLKDLGAINFTRFRIWMISVARTIGRIGPKISICRIGSFSSSSVTIVGSMKRLFSLTPPPRMIFPFVDERSDWMRLNLTALTICPTRDISGLPL